MSSSNFGHQTYILANDFVRDSPQWPSCSSLIICGRPWGGITTRDPQSRQPSCTLSSYIRVVYLTVERFGIYSRRIEQFFVVNGIDDDQVEKRRAIFLSVVGASTFSLIEDLIAPKSVHEVPYKDLIKLLYDHFEPEDSSIVARFRFNSCIRERGESVPVYVARLRKLATSCNYEPSILEEMLRDCLVCGIGNQPLHTRLLSEPGLTLKSANTIAQAHESAAANAA